MSSDSDYDPGENLTNQGYSKNDDFVVDDDDSIDYDEYDSDEITYNYRKRKRKDKSSKSNKKNPILVKIKEEISKKKLTYEDICSSKLPFKEKIWFIEYLRILHNTAINTIEYHDLNSYIVNKFNDYKDMSDDDLKKEVEIKKINKDEESLKQKILRSGYNNNVLAHIYRKYELLLKSSDDNEEKNKHAMWIDWVLNNPRKSKKLFNNDKDLSANLKVLQKNLDKRLYGMKNVKDRVLEIVTSIYSNPNCKNRCIGLIGPPGVGKTVLAQTIAESLALPFSQISLGGAKDSSYLRGHSSTYIGSRPGIIVTSLRKMGYNNGVMLFDELDKIQNTLEGSEVKSTLLHILDYSQNNNFHDDFMPEVSIDLSKIFFIISLNSMNNESDLDNILSDRIPIIKVDGYNTKDRIKIGLNYIVPKIQKQLNFKKNELVINKNIMEYIIFKQIKDELGVRQLERNIRIILERINLLKSQLKNNRKNELNLDYYINDFKIPFIIRRKDINKLFCEYNY
jgi:ATP-dependent Lon protease